jgi:hypothetical protein
MPARVFVDYFHFSPRFLWQKELWSISAGRGDEKQLGVLGFHPIGMFYGVSPKDEIVYVRFNPGKSELWLADFPRR